MTSYSAPARRTLAVLLAAIVALVIAALIVVAMRPAPELRPADTPAGVVQRYLLALQAQNIEQARQYVENRKQDQPCYPYPESSDTAQVDLVREVTTERTSAITVALGANGTDIFALFGGSSYEDQFLLENDGGQWLITAMPWTLGLCTAEELGY